MRLAARPSWTTPRHPREGSGASSSFTRAGIYASASTTGSSAAISRTREARASCGSVPLARVSENERQQDLCTQGGVRAVDREPAQQPPLDDRAHLFAHVVGDLERAERAADGGVAALVPVAKQLGHEGMRVHRRLLVDVLLGQHREVEALLPAEVARDQGCVDPGSLADVAHLGTVVSALVEQLSRSAEQRPAAGGSVPRAAAAILFHD
jgi:hypothetical protein